MYICTLYKIWYHFSSTLNRGVRCSGHIYVSALLSTPSKQFWDLKEEGTIFIIPGSNLSDVINNNTRLCSFVKVFPSCLGRVPGVGRRDETWQRDNVRGIKSGDVRLAATAGNEGPRSLKAPRCKDHKGRALPAALRNY